MSTRFQKMLGLEHPIIQAPMAGVQRSALAIAVSNAGALGTLPCATLNPDEMKRELSLIRANTDNPYNVNFFCHQPPVADASREATWRNTLAPYYLEHGIDPTSIPDPVAEDGPFDVDKLEVLRQFKPAVVSFHFGLPSADLLAAVKEMGSIILCSATIVEEAVWLESQGVDAIIAQGVEAGGHRGMFLTDDITSQVGTFSLLPQIVAEVEVPVIAAGGIASREGIAAALGLGASATQIGTTFLLCDEAETGQVHRDALKSPGSVHTALTNRFSGRPARSIVNRLLREIGPIGVDDVPPFPTAYSALAPLRSVDAERASSDFTQLWSGQNNSQCREIPAAEMIKLLTSEPD
jgi:nitronate monooxygenase